MKKIVFNATVLLVFLLQCTAGAFAAGSWSSLLATLEKDGFKRASLHKLFNRPGMRYDPAPMRGKLRVLHKKYFGGYRTRRVQKDLRTLGYQVGKIDGAYGSQTARAIKAYQKSRGLAVDGVPSNALLAALAKDCNRPRKTRWSSRVYKAVRSPIRLAEAREFVIAHWPVFRAMQERYGVPWEVVAGILAVETRVGHFLGTRSPLVTLASMAACNDLSCAKTFFRKGALNADELAWLKKTVRQRSRWAYDELKALLTYCAANKLDPLNMPGSIYGAFGIGQFMPSSVLRFGVDGDADGDVDLFSVPDAVFSVGAYLHGHGWQGNMSALGKKREVLFAYNHSQQYVNSILEVAARMEQVFALPAPTTGAQYTVRVSDVSGLVRALAPGTRVLLEPGAYDLREASGYAGQYVRCGRNAEGLLIELRGLRNARIEAQRGALLTAGGKGLTLRFTDVQNVLLDGLELESGAEDTALLEFVRTNQALVAHCRLRGGGVRCTDVREFCLANTLVHSLREPGVQLVKSRSVRLRNVVFRSVHADRLLVLRNTDLDVRGCYFHDNGLSKRSGALFEFTAGGAQSTMRDSCLMDNRFARFSTQRGLPKTQNNYLRGNTFKAP